MNEQEFAELIDVRFPYGDDAEWKRLTDLGRSISPNAHFYTLDEIARPPQSAEVTSAKQHEMVRYWAAGFEHPLKDIIVECAVAQIDDRHLTLAQVLHVLDEIAPHRGEWAALAIAYSAYHHEDDLAEDSYEAIRAAWRNEA